ncbi:unnamed protein product [Caenorhabditis brenneri]
MDCHTNALQCMDPPLNSSSPLTVLSNATAYPSNQLLMREFRLTNRVVEMLPDSKHWPRSTRVILLQCIANMAVSSDNMDVMKLALNHIVSRLGSDDEMEIVVAMQALTNLSINIRKDQIQKFVPVIPHCLNRLWVRGEVNLNALRLLVNLSCCPDMVPYLLGNKSVSGLLRILDTDREEGLIRGDPFHNPSHTLYYSIYGLKGREELETQAKHLTNHSNKDVASKSARLLETLANDPFHNPSHTLYYSIYGPKGREELETQAKHLTNHSNKDVASKMPKMKP